MHCTVDLCMRNSHAHSKSQNLSSFVISAQDSGNRLVFPLCWNFRTICMEVRNRVGIELSYRPTRAGIFEQSMGARNRLGIWLTYRPARLARAHICRRLWSPGIDSEESISPTYVAWRAGTKNRVVVPSRQAGNRFLVSLKGLQIYGLSLGWLAGATTWFLLSS